MGCSVRGNFGDGKINAFDPETGAFIDTVRDPEGKPIIIDGLRGLQVGNGTSGGLNNAVYFTAGPKQRGGRFVRQPQPQLTSSR
jgi:hypothetical protein